jgi:hypothetical protein
MSQPLHPNFSTTYEQSDTFREAERLRKRYQKYVKAGRWIYCKYCYGNRRPIIDWYDGLIKCGNCDYGLWPLQDDFNIKLWIIGRWLEYIELKFIVHNIEYDLKTKDFKEHTEEELINSLNKCNAGIKEIQTAVGEWR